jgi:ribonucleoside-diphosphate reductase alpha chain
LVRRVLDGRVLSEVNPMVSAALAPLGEIGRAAVQSVLARGSIRQIRELPEELRLRFPTALEISPEFHLRMQAAFQAHIDAAVSKTVNLPAHAPPEAVAEVFSLARRLGLKGVTVYRYGSRPGQTLSVGDEHARPDCRECAV